MELIATLLVALCAMALLVVLADRQAETTRRYEAIEKKLARIADELGIDDA